MAGRLKKRTLRWLIPVHRYLGLGMSLVLLLWFASGIVMMFEGYPRTSSTDRMAWLSPLVTDELLVPPSGAGQTLGIDSPAHMRLNQPGERPRIHLMDSDGQWHSAYADTGRPAPPLSRQQAGARAERVNGGTATRITLLKGPDQWTVNNHVEAPTPLWRVELADGAGTHLYLSRPTGEVLHATTFHERAWGYAGPVIHWIYPTRLKALGGLWRQVVLWLSGIGTLACLSGVVMGLMLIRRNRRRGGFSPFRGWFRWHHYLGLVFGLFATTWIFSGLLSMYPFSWPSVDQDAPVTQRFGTDVAELDSDVIAPSAIDSLKDRPIRELRLHRFDGDLYYRSMAASGKERLHPSTDSGKGEAGLTVEQIFRAAQRLGGHELTVFREQIQYDSYYYAGRAARMDEAPPPLPVYRAEYRDGTRLYIDPATGSVLHTSTPLGRTNRWLYHGLHNLDFPTLNPGSLFWYVLVLILMAGGTALSFTGVWMSARYIAGKRRR